MTEPYDSTEDTHDHIGRVSELLWRAENNLMNRALVHDQSKLRSPEKEAFDLLGQRQRGITYGTDEYYAQFEATPEMGPALAHHYLFNSHHPEHHAMTYEGALVKDEVKDGTAVSRMSLLDLLEMLCDWRAASERYKDGSIADSIEHNTERFGLSPQLASILRNTVEELGL